ncbi:hypothetical protein MCOR25_005189 [Pyricularia grisea]|uniref:Uncharacterized protein n=1 Tax=Pyricularia grisea TaxID=148305 RepID=A0A6P8BAM8_PYRGI|nr:uncharacterized protein PgNI_04875 [Pyricularia grisea]KAI6365952.1 hypothetical protein MCOR25_005189 [Pyricularia grisea]TLD12742.1 hypothetical protein PgNI_04875 [Pyricularia grisea]
MESIQLAQMLADLSDLDAAQEASAALALVNANKNLPIANSATHDHTSTPKATERHHHRVASAQPAINRTSSPATMFDKFGRKMFTPPMTRSNSTQGSIPGTPRRDQEMEDDVDRASTLISLYEIRAKIKQQDNSSLIRAREKIQALAAKQQAQTATEKKDTAQNPRYNYPKQT